MVAYSRTAGFTLIEVLLSTVLLSLLMLSAAALYDHVGQNWQRNQKSYNKALEQYIDWQLVHQSVSSTYPKLVYPNQPTPSNRLSLYPTFYFLGRDDGFTAITRYSVQKPDSSAVYRLFREADPQNPQRWQLVYEEAVLDNKILQHAEQQLPFNFRRVLLNNLSDLRFQYKGWNSIDELLQHQRESEDSYYSGDWVSNYDSLITSNHPQQVSILAKDFEWQLFIPPEASMSRAHLETDL